MIYEIRTYQLRVGSLAEVERRKLGALRPLPSLPPGGLCRQSRRSDRSEAGAVSQDNPVLGGGGATSPPL